MEDRANVAIVIPHKNKVEFVCLYTHLGGYELAKTVQTSLKKKWRWGDEPYLARIIFQEMVGDDKGDRGFGISTGICDNEHPIIVIDGVEKRVGFVEEEIFVKARDAYKMPEMSVAWSMEEFCALSAEKLEKAWTGDE